MLFLSYECLLQWENVSKWNCLDFSPEAFSLSRLWPPLVAIEKGNAKSKFQVWLCIQFGKCVHKNIYLESEWTKTDGVWIISHHAFTFLSQDCFIHKSKGSYIMQMLIRKKCSIKSKNPSCVTTPWGPLSIAERKKGGCCLGMHICSIYGPSASFISPNWHIFLDLFLLLQRSIQRLFSRWGSKSLCRFVILSLATVRLIHPSTCRGDICSSADHLRLFFSTLRHSLWRQICVSCLRVRQVRLSPLNPEKRCPIARGFKTVKRDMFFLSS